jgi:hypothetical protein
METFQMAKKKRKKQKKSRSRKQNLLRAHARRAMPHLPPGAQLRIEPRGEVRMSEVLEAFVEPYLGLASTDNGRRALLQIASLAWNAAILPAEERRALLDRVADTSFLGFQGEAREEVQDLLANMIARKLALFDENKRIILGVELTGAEGGYLSVISTVAGSSERD